MVLKNEATDKTPLASIENTFPKRTSFKLSEKTFPGGRCVGTRHLLPLAKPA
jgi:hypothetical protein